MGIKSTRTLKRSDALELYHQLRAELLGVEGELSNAELSTALEDMQDALAERRGSTNFDNFHVLDDVNYDTLYGDGEDY